MKLPNILRAAPGLGVEKEMAAAWRGRMSVRFEVMEASVRRYLERQVVLQVLTLESYLSEHARALCNRTKIFRRRMSWCPNKRGGHEKSKCWSRVAGYAKPHYWGSLKSVISYNSRHQSHPSLHHRSHVSDVHLRRKQ